MRVIGAALCLAGLAAPANAPAAETPDLELVAVYWEPPGAPSLGKIARGAFADAMRPLGARLVEASATPPMVPPLRPSLEAAKADYGRFAFADALSKLDELQHLVDARGGGDLDGRQLSEVFLYRGLCRLELGPAEAAWDDLVHAARLDPERVVDPDRFQPRAVKAYRRAIEEVALLPRAELQLDVPGDAAIRVDGAPATGTLGLTLGQHFVAVSALGYEPWAGVVSVVGAHTRFAPPLHSYVPPDGDRLLALAGEGRTRELLLGALERAPSGWRFVARDVELPDGKFVSDAIALEGAPVAASVRKLVTRLRTFAREGAPRPPRSRWWVWALGGGAVALAIAVSIGIALSQSSNLSSIGGTYPGNQ